MNKIMIIGCPGSGKSTLSKEMEEILSFPVFHFDYVYHIDNVTHIPREELIDKLINFMEKHDQFILDGNYASTIPFRLQYCDTVILFDVPTKICINNVIERTKSNVPREDMAPGFDLSKMDDDFLDFIREFKKKELPSIKKQLSDFKGNILTIKNYKEKEEFLDSLLSKR